MYGCVRRATSYFILVSCAQPGGQTEGHEEREQQGEGKDGEGRQGSRRRRMRGLSSVSAVSLNDSFFRWKRSRLRGLGDATQVLCPADLVDHPLPPLPIRLWGSPSVGG